MRTEDISVQFSEAARKDIDRLKGLLGVNSLGEVLQKAISTQLYFSEKEEAGFEVIVRRPGANQETIVSFRRGGPAGTS